MCAITSVLLKQPDSSDVTACHWKVVSCKTAFQDPNFHHDHVVFQFFGKKYSKERLQDSVFLIIMQNSQFRLEHFQCVRDHGIFQLQ